MLGVDRLIAWPEIGMGDELQQFVGTRTADDARRIEPVTLGDRLAQIIGRAVGIKGKRIGRRREGFERLGARAQGRLVRRQFEDARTLGAALSWHIGRDVADPRLGLGRGREADDVMI